LLSQNREDGRKPSRACQRVARVGAALWLVAHICFAKRFAVVVNLKPRSTACYTDWVTKLLDEAIERLRQLPATMQDSAARALILQLEEEPEAGDREAIFEGRRQFQRGEFVTHSK